MLRSHVALWASAFVLAFFLVGHYFVGPDPARVVVTSLAIGMWFSVCLNWTSRFLIAVRAGVSNGAHNIYVGIWLTGVVIILYSIWVIYLITEGRPPWSRETPIGGLFYAGYFLAAASLMSAPLNTQDKIEPVSLRWWFTAVGLGGVLAGVLMTLAFVGVVALPG